MKPLSRLIAAAAFVAVAAFAPLGSRANAALPRPFTEQSFAQIRASHAGQPLIVHVWGMSCGPCLVELPKWSRLLHRHPQMKLVLIEVDQAPLRASEQTLQRAGLGRVESWSVTSPLDEYLRASIDPKWFGDMPRTLLIAANGTITTMRGIADLDAVAKWLDTQPPASTRLSAATSKRSHGD